MTRVNVQFHADPSELVRQLLPRWLGDLECFLVAEDDNLTRLHLSKRELPTFDRVGTLERVLVRLTPFVSRDDATVRFLRANEGFLSLSPGRLWNGQLRESALGSLATDQEVVAAWRGVVRRARTDLNRGAVLVNARQERFDDPGHLYSDGAFELSRGGVKMLAIAGSASFELGHSTVGGSNNLSTGS